MSYSEYESLLKERGTPRTDTEGGEIALKKSDALQALALLADTDIGVLGGDVYELESDGYFRPTYDNWYYNKDESAPSLFAEKSRQIAQEYLSKYKEQEGLDIRYVLVIDI